MYFEYILLFNNTNYHEYPATYTRILTIHTLWLDASRFSIYF